MHTANTFSWKDQAGSSRYKYECVCGNNNIGVLSCGTHCFSMSPNLRTLILDVKEGDAPKSLRARRVCAMS